jgi:hypothetical protein
VKNISEALSCRLWACEKTQTKKELYDPECIIVFVQATVPVGYITVCSKSKMVECQPISDNKEIALMNTILYRITHKD